VLTLKTLGGVALFRDGAPIGGRSSQRRRLALLAVLAVAGEKGVSRDKAVSFLWPEHDTNRARHALSQLLYAIRRDLGDECILAGVDDLRLNVSCVGTDVGTFERARLTGDLDAAVTAYSGAFLDGFFLGNAPGFETWAGQERERLESAFRDVLVEQARAAGARGDAQSRTEWLKRIWHLDPLNAVAIRDLLLALEAMGDRAIAIRYARRYEAQLRDETGLEPGSEIQALISRMTRPQETSKSVGVAPDQAASGARGIRDELPGDDSAGDHAGPAASPTIHGRRRALVGLSMVPLIALAMMVTTQRGVRKAGIPGVIVLGAVQGPDTTLALAVAEVLRSELAASKSLRVLSQASLGQTLQLMKKDPGFPLADSVALEVADRRGVPFVLLTTAAPLGSGARIVARLIETRGPDTEGLTLAVDAAESKEVIPAVRRLALDVRSRVTGRRSPTVALDPLPAVSTSSLPALRAYAMARRAAASGDRWQAVAHGLTAVALDSNFAMAHYLLGDQFWFLDRQSRSDYHLTAAVRLGGRLPLRERLVVRARYMHIVRDNLDSATVYWNQLVSAFPDEALGYEGRAWTHRADGRYLEAFYAADSALRLDPDARSPNENNKLQALLEARPSGHVDTAAALAYAATLGSWALVQAQRTAAMERGDWEAALRSIDATYPPMPGCGSYWAAPERQAVLIAANRVAEAAREVQTILCWANGPGGWPLSQMYIPNTLLMQGRAEVLDSVTRRRAVGYAMRALDFVDSADISVPAIARIVERAADIGARGNDSQVVSRARQMLLLRDAGRGLPSYRLALLTIEAADAFQHGDMEVAADRAHRARQRTFHGRSLHIATLLEADALAAVGDRDSADSLYRQAQAPAAYLDRRMTGRLAVR
jgi:DNA-binding SARP family transcriptional activator